MQTSQIKPDVLVLNPVHVDYPYFRWQIRKYRYLFNQVFVVFQSFNSPFFDYSSFAKTCLEEDNVVCTNIPFCSLKHSDWRDYATNTLLSYSKSSHVLFFEQDFLIYHPTMMEEILSVDQEVCYWEEKIHPAFMFVRRSTIDRTSLNFGVAPGVHDHFGRFERDLQAGGHKFLYLQDIGYKDKVDYDHIRAITYNYDQLMNAALHIFRPERYITYLQECLALNIPLHPNWIKNTMKHITLLEARGIKGMPPVSRISNG